MPAFSGYSPTEARKIATGIDSAVNRAKRNAMVESYSEYAAESRACGFDPETLAEYLGEAPTGKIAASSRWAFIPSDELDIY
jgi:hypothetical protein